MELPAYNYIRKSDVGKYCFRVSNFCKNLTTLLSKMIFMTTSAKFVLLSMVYLRNSVWQKGDKHGPVVNGLAKSEIDFSGTPVTLTHERLSLATPIYPAIPFRLVRGEPKYGVNNNCINLILEVFFCFGVHCLLNQLASTIFFLRCIHQFGT